MSAAVAYMSRIVWRGMFSPTAIASFPSPHMFTVVEIVTAEISNTKNGSLNLLFIKKGKGWKSHIGDS